MTKAKQIEQWELVHFDTENKTIYCIENMEIIGNYKIKNGVIHIKVLSEYLIDDEEIINDKIIMNGLDSEVKSISIEELILKEDKSNNTEHKLLKTQTGIAAEYYVAGELSRLGYNVTLTFGNTKSIDLLIEKDDNVIAIQVKGIQKTKSICWNLDKSKIKEKTYYVLVNLHIDKPKEKPDFFVLTSSEARQLFKNTPKQGENRTYLDYKTLKKLDGYQDNWNKLELLKPPQT